MHTNNTPHYNLPQFIGSDIPNPLTDWNDSMQDIDTAMYEIKTQADEIGSDIVQDESDISDLQSQANLTDDNITLLNQQTTAARSAATDAQDAANRNASNITTLQQSVANNRTSITQYNNRFNQNVPFAFGIEEVEDPDNPGTMIDQYGYYTNDDPSQFIPFGESAIANILGLKIATVTNAKTITISDIKANSEFIAYLAAANNDSPFNTANISIAAGSGEVDTSTAELSSTHHGLIPVGSGAIYTAACTYRGRFIGSNNSMTLTGSISASSLMTEGTIMIVAYVEA